MVLAAAESTPATIASARSSNTLVPGALAAAPPVKAPVRIGWIIQVGAYPDERAAKQQLASVKTKAGHFLAKADPFTESVLKGDTIYFRARFAGLDKDQAEAACKYFKRNDIACLTIKN